MCLLRLRIGFGSGLSMLLRVTRKVLVVFQAEF